MGRHVVHAAVPLRIEPRRKPRLGAAQVDIGAADLGKSQFLGPRAKALPDDAQPLLVKRRAPLLMTRLHRPILESCPDGGLGREGLAPAGSQPSQRIIRWRDESDCAACAQRLARSPALQDALLLLHGPLGAGKTSFVRHLLRALGVQGRIKSPSYALVEPYESLHDGRRIAITHADFYRFNDPREWLDAGLREPFAARGLKLVEWPERAGALLPPADLELRLEPVDESMRRVHASAGSDVGRELLARL